MCVSRLYTTFDIIGGGAKLPTVAHIRRLSIHFHKRSAKSTCTCMASPTAFLEVKGKGQYICIAPYCRQPTSKALR